MATPPGKTPQDQIKDISGQLENAFRSISENIKDIMQDALSETDNVVQSYGKSIAASIKQFSKETDKILENDRKIRQGLISQKDITKQINAIQDKRINLQQRIDNLMKEDVRAARALQGELDAVNRLSEEFEETLREQEATLGEIEKKTGLLGAAMKGISKIPFASQFVSAEESLVAMNAAAANGANKLQIMGKGIEASSKKASGALLGLIGNTVMDRFKLIDKNSEALARNLGMSYDNASKLSDRYVKIARSGENVFVRSENLTKTTNDLVDQLGIAVDLDDKRLFYATRIREEAGFSSEFTNELVKLSSVRGENEEDIMKAANAQVTAVKLQTGINLNNRKVLESIVKSSNAIKVNFAANPAALAAAAAKTKALGLELNRVDDIAGSLTDFESSIQSQMEAELLTGKALNADRARYQALTNDTAGLAKTIAEDLGTAAEYGKMNRIQQESLAKAYGMSREEVSQMLLDQQIMQATGGKTLAQQQQAYAEAVKQGKEKEFLAQLGDKELQTQFEQNSLQTRQAAIQEKLASSMDEFAKAIRPVAELFTTIAGTISKFPGLIKAATIAFLAFKAASMFGKGGGGGSLLTGGLGKILGGGGGAAASTAASATAGGGAMAGMAKQVAAMKAANPGMTSAQALSSIKAGGAAAAPAAAPAAAAGGGGLFSKIGGFFKKLNPIEAVKNSVKGMGGAKGLLKKGLKGSVLNTVLTGFFAYNDVKDLIQNPTDENGNKLSKEALNKKVGGILMGGVGGILGGILGTALGGPIGSIVGSMGGQWLFEKLGEWFPDFSEGFGDIAIGTGVFGTPKLAEGGIVTSTGLAKVDKGEVYLGANSITVLRDMLNALQEQNRIMTALLAKNTAVQIDGQVIANVVAKNAPMAYGNLLNPSSRAYG